MQKQLMHWDVKKTQITIYVLIGLYLLLFLPFWKPTLLGFLFAAALAPLVNTLRKRLHAKRASVAYATVGIVLTLFIGLVALVALQGYSQLYDLFTDPNTMTNFNNKIATVRDQFLSWADGQKYLHSFNVKEQLDKAVNGISNSAKTFVLFIAQGFIAEAPVILLDLFLFVLAFGAFLVIQPRLWNSASSALRLGDRGREHFRRFEKICGLALGSVILTGVLQSILVVLGALIGGYESLFMIFAVTLIFAMIPLLGAGLVPFFLMCAAFLQSDFKSGLIMLATAAIVGVADNVLRAWLFSRAAKSNPALSIISLLGGIALFGFAGLFVAPVIEQLVMTYAFSDEGEPLPSQVTASSETSASTNAVSTASTDAAPRPGSRKAYDSNLVPQP